MSTTEDLAQVLYEVVGELATSADCPFSSDHASDWLGRLHSLKGGDRDTMAGDES